MDGSFRADLPALADLVHRMSRFEAHAHEVAGQLDDKVAQLHAEWSGAAADEHLTAHRAWRDGAHEMHAALAELRQVISTAHANYGAAVEAGRAMWG